MFFIIESGRKHECINNIKALKNKKKYALNNVGSSSVIPSCLEVIQYLKQNKTKTQKK